jgi:hypothetical protein
MNTLSNEDISEAEEMSRQLEDWGLLGAYENMLQSVASRRVAIPSSHLFEFAAREFERYGKRLRNGMINELKEKRIATYRQKQVSRRIRDTARELSFDRNVLINEVNSAEQFLMQSVDQNVNQNVNQRANQRTDSWTDEQEFQHRVERDDVEEFLIQDVEVSYIVKKDDIIENETVIETEETIKEYPINSETPTPEKLGFVKSTKKIEEESNELIETEKKLNDLKVFAPMLLNMIFTSIDRVDQPVVDQPVKDHSVVDHSVVDQSVVDQSVVDQSVLDQLQQQLEEMHSTDSSDLSSGSDVSLLSESIQDQEIEVTKFESDSTEVLKVDIQTAEPM